MSGERTQSKASQLMALAVRAEQASGPDRELDADIAVALSIGARRLLPDDHEYLAKVRRDDQCAAGTYWFKCRSGASLRTSLSYTTSLDAAMTLVPEEFKLARLAEWIGWVMRDKGAWQVALTRLTPSRTRVEVEHAATPALALTAAALKAHALLDKEPQE